MFIRQPIHLCLHSDTFAMFLSPLVTRRSMYRVRFSRKKKKSLKFIETTKFRIFVWINFTESVATLPPFGPIEGQKWFDRISSQWESQKNRFAFISFGKNQFLPPCIWNLPFMSTASYSLLIYNCTLYTVQSWRALIQVVLQYIDTSMYIRVHRSRRINCRGRSKDDCLILSQPLESMHWLNYLPTSCIIQVLCIAVGNQPLQYYTCSLTIRRSVYVSSISPKYTINPNTDHRWHSSISWVYSKIRYLSLNFLKIYGG
jgi:hypothetical protein